MFQTKSKFSSWYLKHVRSLHQISDRQTGGQAGDAGGHGNVQHFSYHSQSEEVGNQLAKHHGKFACALLIGFIHPLTSAK